MSETFALYMLQRRPRSARNPPAQATSEVVALFCVRMSVCCCCCFCLVLFVFCHARRCVAFIRRTCIFPLQYNNTFTHSLILLFLEPFVFVHNYTKSYHTHRVQFDMFMTYIYRCNGGDHAGDYVTSSLIPH